MAFHFIICEAYHLHHFSNLLWSGHYSKQTSYRDKTNFFQFQMEDSEFNREIK